MYKRLKLSARIIAKCQKRGEFVSDVKLVNSAKWWSKFPNLIVWPTEKIGPFFNVKCDVKKQVRDQQEYF